MPRRPARRFRPAPDPLEPRALLSVATPTPAPTRPPAIGTPLVIRPAAEPTRASSLVAHFFGPYTTTPGRSADVRAQTLLRGGGGANVFRHGDLLLTLAVPADPSEPITGTASLFDKNYPQTGTALVLDLEGPAPGAAAPGGRVTRLGWTVSDSSQGAFTDASGSGTVEFRWRPAGRSGRLPERGSLGVQFRGRIETNPALNPIRID
jgi:hypothetical protein